MIPRCAECGDVRLSPAVIDYLLRLVTVEGAFDEESRHLSEEDSAAYAQAILELEAVRGSPIEE